MTTRDPGDRVVLTQGRRPRPRPAAFRASRPAATITWGLEVLVQEVMAAMATVPWPSRCRRPSSTTSTAGTGAVA
jgi:hypothetical protein